MEHDDRDPEFESLDALLDSKAASQPTTEQTPEPTEESKPCEQTPAEPPTPVQAEPVADAAAASSNDLSIDETVDSESLTEPIGAVDVPSALGEWSEQELAAIRDSQGPTGEANPELLKTLLDAKHAEERVEQLRYVPIQTGNGKNPGYTVSNLKTPKELAIEDKLAEAYERDYYDARKLTLDQACEVHDNLCLEELYISRKKSAVKRAVEDLIKEQNLSPADAQAVRSDLASTPGSYAVRDIKKARRSEPKVAGESKPKALSAKAKAEADALFEVYGDWDSVIRKLNKADKLTPEMAEYIRSRKQGS